MINTKTIKIKIKIKIKSETDQKIWKSPRQEILENISPLR
jgi:hypothetical protein